MKTKTTIKYVTLTILILTSLISLSLVSSAGSVKSGWSTDSTGRHIYISYTGAVIDYDKTIGGKQYFWNESAGLILADGFRETEGGTVCYESGIKVTGWRHSDGSPAGFVGYTAEQYSSKPDKLYYFLSTTGYMITESSYTLGGYKREFNPDHTVKPLSGLQMKDGKLSYYENGEYRRGWYTFSEKTYYFMSDGSGAASMWQTIGGKVYYFAAGTSAEPYALKTSGTIGGIDYPFDPESGCVLPDGLFNFEYAKANHNNTAAYVKAVTPTLRFYKKGVIQYGWQKIGNDVYYFYAEGSANGAGNICLESRTIGGVFYEFDAFGVCLSEENPLSGTGPSVTPTPENTEAPVTEIPVTEAPETTEEKEDRFVKYTDTLSEGDYLIVYNNKAMLATVYNSRLDYDIISPEKDGTVNAADISEYAVWHISKSGSFWVIYNDASDSYAAGIGIKNKAGLQSTVDSYALWTVSGSGTFDFRNKGNTSDHVNAFLRENGDIGFGCYAESFAGKLTLYKLDGEYIPTSGDDTEAPVPTDTDIPEIDYNTKRDTSDGYVGIPSVGDVKCLVVPIEFSDEKFSAKELADLRIAFSGTESETGWESVASFYRKSSNEKLSLSFEITDVFTVNERSGSFNSKYKKYYSGYSDTNPINTVLASVASKYAAVYDLAGEFDSNDDNMIDGIYLVYAADIDYENDDSVWWAWTDLDAYASAVASKSGTVYPCNYIWLGVDFIYDAAAYGETEADDLFFTINAETIIHETGHLLGLDDYYDFDLSSGTSGGLGGGDMMDGNVGDHSLPSKLILGWGGNETVLDASVKSVTMTIGDESTGECIIIKKDKTSDSFYTEYILIDLYSPVGLNKAAEGYSGLPVGDAVRIYHVDMTLDQSYYEDYGRYNRFMYNNGDASHKSVALIEQDNDNSISSTKYYSSGNYADMDDYYLEGDRMPSVKWYSGVSVDFSAYIVSIDSAAHTATVTVTFN